MHRFFFALVNCLVVIMGAWCLIHRVVFDDHVIGFIVFFTPSLMAFGETFYEADQLT